MEGKAIYTQSMAPIQNNGKKGAFYRGLIVKMIAMKRKAWKLADKNIQNMPNYLALHPKPLGATKKVI